MADKTKIIGQVPDINPDEIKKALLKAQEESDLENYLIEKQQPNVNKQLDPKNKISQANDAFRKKVSDSRSEKDLISKIKSRFDTPGTIDPKLLMDEGARDINLGALGGEAEKLAKLKVLGRIARGASKALPIVGLAADVATTPMVGEGSDIIPGRPSFDENYPKNNRTLAGKK